VLNEPVVISPSTAGAAKSPMGRRLLAGRQIGLRATRTPIDMLRRAKKKAGVAPRPELARSSGGRGGDADLHITLAESSSVHIDAAEPRY
jgi:hypothetical protein